MTDKRPLLALAIALATAPFLFTTAAAAPAVGTVLHVAAQAKSCQSATGPFDEGYIAITGRGGFSTVRGTVYDGTCGHGCDDWIEGEFQTSDGLWFSFSMFEFPKDETGSCVAHCYFSTHDGPKEYTSSHGYIDIPGPGSVSDVYFDCVSDVPSTWVFGGNFPDVRFY